MNNVPTESGLFELLASVEGVTKLQQTAVVLADRGDEVAARVELSKRKLVVVLVVKDVQERGQEGVEVLEGEDEHSVAGITRQRTSMTGNSVRIESSFSSNDCCVNLTFFM